MSSLFLFLSFLLLLSLTPTPTTSQWTPEQLGVNIPMRDGKFLSANIFLPPVEGTYPTIFVHTPYNKQLTLGPFGPDSDSPTYRDKFAYVIVDWRGFFGSVSAFILNPNNGEDGFDVIEWIETQIWSNGKIGTSGISAVGKVQLDTASENPSGLDCIIPGSATTGFRHFDFFFGGCLLKVYADFISLYYGVPLSMILDNPLPTDFVWTTTQNAAEAKTNAIDVPTLLVSGWFDIHSEHRVAFLDELRNGKAFESNMKILLGPWTHSGFGDLEQGELSFPEAEDFYNQAQLEMYDYYLEGNDAADSAWAQFPRYRYFEMGTNQWLGSDSWPPEESEMVPFYLTDDSQLTDVVPGTAETTHSYSYDPADPTPTHGGRHILLADGPLDQSVVVESRSDVLVYTSAVLEDRVRIAGNPFVRLQVSSDCPDTDFAVRMTDVYPDGSSYLMVDGIQKARYRDGYVETPVFMETGQTYMVDVHLPPIAHSFEPGHRIRISISSANYPQFEISNNTIDNSDPGVIALNEIHVGGSSSPSALMLPVFVDNVGPGGGGPDPNIALYVGVSVGAVGALVLIGLFVTIIIIVVVVVKKRNGGSDREMTSY